MEQLRSIIELPEKSKHAPRQSDNRCDHPVMIKNLDIIYAIKNETLLGRIQHAIQTYINECKMEPKKIMFSPDTCKEIVTYCSKMVRGERHLSTCFGYSVCESTFITNDQILICQ